MAPPKTIVSTLFQNKGNLSAERLEELTVDCFTLAERFIAGQAGGKLAAAICVNLDECGIRSSFFALTGPLRLGLNIKANQLWNIADDTVKMQITLMDASMFKFEREQEGTKSFSNWIDGLQKCNPKFFRNGEELDFNATVTEFPDMASGFSLRAYITTDKTVSTLKMGVQAIPYSGQDLTELVVAGKQVFSWACPQAKIQIGKSNKGHRKTS